MSRCIKVDDLETLEYEMSDFLTGDIKSNPDGSFDCPLMGCYKGQNDYTLHVEPGQFVSYGKGVWRIVKEP